MGKSRKRAILGDPPLDPPKPPQKPPKTPPRAGRLWASGTRLCIWPLHPIAQGGKSCRNYALIRIAAGGGGVAKVADFRPPSGGPKSPIFHLFPPRRAREMDQFSCSAEILIVYAPRKFLDNHFMIVRGRAEPRHRADVRVMNVFTLMTPTLCTARRSEKHPTGPTSSLHQFLCARILAPPEIPTCADFAILLIAQTTKHVGTQLRDTTLRAVWTTESRLRGERGQHYKYILGGRVWFFYGLLFLNQG